MRRRALSQNFFHNRKLVEKLVRLSSIGQNDTVLEIGPGRGIITQELLQKSRKVIAVELDTQLVTALQTKFKDQLHKLHLVNKDILAFKLPSFQYKVVSNTPFSIEGKIIRKLLNADNPPEISYLVMRKDLAKRLSGKYNEGFFSAYYKPWFRFTVLYYFQKIDYKPAATMDTVYLRIEKKDDPQLNSNLQKKYGIFLAQTFGGGKTLKHNLKAFLSYEQMKRLSKKYGFQIDSRPTDIKYEQWVGIFQFLLSTGKI